ncbi:dephospho-CoA kinase [Glycocaulis profundi]|nr:dephospho-CoA kinase [Glycocaulis profundi]
MIVIGLTGSIGMGKSTTARLFAEEGAHVFDADAAVAVLYAPGGAAVGPVGEAFPDAIHEGGVDRVRLSDALRRDPKGFERLEAIVHPLVGRARDDFFAKARDEGAEFAVLDVPLLFEADLAHLVDVIAVVTAPEDIQRERVLARANMDEAKLDAILSRQMPDHEKRARAHLIIDTSGGIEQAREQVRLALDTLRRDPGLA